MLVVIVLNTNTLMLRFNLNKIIKIMKLYFKQLNSILFYNLVGLSCRKHFDTKYLLPLNKYYKAAKK
jgi:alpha-N-acetylglucosamine transferase